MAILLENIHSLSDFQRNTKKYVTKLKSSGEPTVLTVNGEAELVVQSARGYQELLNAKKALEEMRSLAISREQASRGELEDTNEFLNQLAKENGISLK